MNGLDQRALLRHTVDVVGDANRQRLATAWLDRQLSRMEDDGFAARFAETCPVPGVDASSYRIQWIPGRPGVLAGIRFKGGDVAFPFVELIAWDAPLREPHVWRDVRRRLATRFNEFSPHALRVRWPGEQPPAADEGATLDQWLLSGALTELRRQPLGDLPAELTIEAPSDWSWYPRFQAGFSSWQSAAGHVGDEVAMATRAELEECSLTGKVLCLWDGEVWGGVVAARREDERSVGGYCVVEEFLDTDLRGHGLARHLQRHLVEHLEDTGRDSLWGTVHASNGPSVATALSAGRRKHEGWWFLPLPDVVRKRAPRVS